MKTKKRPVRSLSVAIVRRPFRVFRTHEGARKYMNHFSIGQQSFCIAGARTLGEAKWFERQLEIALARLAALWPNIEVSGAKRPLD
jgi:hypothetical protein